MGCLAKQAKNEFSRQHHVHSALTPSAFGMVSAFCCLPKHYHCQRLTDNDLSSSTPEGRAALTRSNGRNSTIDAHSRSQSPNPQRHCQLASQARSTWLPQVQERPAQSHTSHRPRTSSVGIRPEEYLHPLTPHRCTENAENSKLLRVLPAEIRLMIWEFALGGQTIRLRTKPDLLGAVYDPADRFPLLRIYRQIYSEAAVLPHSLTTFFSFDTDIYRSYIKAGLVKRIKHIRIGFGYRDHDTTKFAWKYVPNLLTAEVVLSGWSHENSLDEFRTDVSTAFPTASIIVRRGRYNQRLSVWNGQLPFENLAHFSLVSHNPSSTSYAAKIVAVSPTQGRKHGGIEEQLDTLCGIEVGTG